MVHVSSNTNIRILNPSPVPYVKYSLSNISCILTNREDSIRVTMDSRKINVTSILPFCKIMDITNCDMSTVNGSTNPSRSSNGLRFQHLFHRAVTRPRSRNIANLLLCAVSLSSTRKAAQRRVYCDRHERLGCYVREQAVCNSSSAAQKRRTSPGPKACYHLGTSRYCDYAARSAGERPNREIYRRRRNAARISKDDVPRHVFAVLDLTRISAPTFFESG